MNNSFSADAPTFSYKVTTTTNQQTIKGNQNLSTEAFKEAAERYELRRSSRSQGSSNIKNLNQQSTTVKSMYQEQDQKVINDDFEQQRQSSRVIEKYNNTTTQYGLISSKQQDMRLSAQQVVQKYSKDGTATYDYRNSQYQPQQQQQTVISTIDKPIEVNTKNTEYKQTYSYSQRKSKYNEDEENLFIEKEQQNTSNNYNYRDAPQKIEKYIETNYENIKQEILNQNTVLKKPEREPNQVDAELQDSDYVSCNII